MEKVKIFRNTFFPVETLKKAIWEFDSLAKTRCVQYVKRGDPKEEKQTDEDIFSRFTSRDMRIRQSNEEWIYDSEDEFFGDYRKFEHDSSQNYFLYKRTPFGSAFEIESELCTNSKVSVRFYPNSKSRAFIERVFDVFETDFQKSKLPYEHIEKPKIFIGHGRRKLWRDLKDHLEDKHFYKVEAYEVGSRSGHAIRDILEDMLAKSSFAILVMTAEDETSDGQFRVRQNVVHETGLFQERLGFNRAIVLLEEGVELFSNMDGIDQIRFSKGNIRETFGDILAAVKREFY